MNKNIKKFSLADIDKIIDIWYQSNIDTYTFINKNYFKNIKENVKKKFISNYNNIYVYEENTEIKAFCLIDNDYIDELYVSNAYRNQGIGTKILNHLKNNNNKLTLNIFQKNIKGINFYQKNGFKIIEENTEDITQEKGYYMEWKNQN